MSNSNGAGGPSSPTHSNRQNEEHNAPRPGIQGNWGSLRPAAAQSLTAFEVADEVVLFSDWDERVFALNASGYAIWQLCNGTRTLSEIHTDLCSRFEGDSVAIFSDLTTALFQFTELGLLESSSLRVPRQSLSEAATLAASSPRRPRVRIVHGIEDTPYFHWQISIMFESLVGQMPPGWDISVVVCNGQQPISSELRHIFETYNVTHYLGEAHADTRDIDFAGGGDNYVPINRVEALSVIARHVAAEDVVCLMDTDIFLYGQLQEDLFPTGNALASNWIIAQEKFMGFSTHDKVGLSLPKLLEALGVESEFKPGGVMVFMTGETLQRNDYKVVQDCFRFLQIIYLCAKILDLPHHGAWVAEMACFAMALYPSGMDYELLEIDQFSILDQSADELPEGSFFHYYTDLNDAVDHPGPFRDSLWHKQLFRDRDFLQCDIESFAQDASGSAEKRFMKLALKARERLYGHTRH